MATCMHAVWKAVAGCRRHLLNGGVPALPAFPSSNIPIRTFAAVKSWKKGKKEEAATPEVKKEKMVVNDSDRHKPFGKTAWAPVDDVYILRYYPRTVYSAAEALALLKSFQALDFTPRDQPVYMDLKLDMKLEKKKKIDPFVSTVHLPHPFKTDVNKVLVFTEDAHQKKVAQEGGASFVGGAELVQQILDDEVVADFYVAVPEMLQKLTPLKNKLRKKFPKSKRGSVSVNIPKMLSLFRMGHEYAVESERYVRTQVATLDFPTEQILANLQTILIDVCSHRPANMGPLIERAILSSRTSEALWFNNEQLLPKTPEDNKDQ
ncbi:39S ribosomal protein L1, mitochondrial isoform X1 [Phyllopteryx taeniolatus]|uniref:39S ribosomal protein L1, mitochondrial isoform X1 n=2 Tax=Phyllopteryx taeniolatus TaxID=161469 RepID=UPI002AD36C14|nr:39S ribosomal protein L1, mitochondrial isoform X1 [Phyllopteryx taeniolatus]